MRGRLYTLSPLIFLIGQSLILFAGYRCLADISPWLQQFRALFVDFVWFIAAKQATDLNV